MFGVVAIPYEYEGTTLDALMEKLRLALQGRQARWEFSCDYEQYTRCREKLY